LATAPHWGSGGFTVQERGSLALNYVAVEGALVVLGGSSAGLSGCMLAASASLAVTDGGSLRLSLMAVSAAVLGVAENQLSGASIPRGTCGVSYSRYGLGGGWVVCFV
jgi:hypothetical protein